MLRFRERLRRINIGRKAPHDVKTERGLTRNGASEAALMTGTGIMTRISGHMRRRTKREERQIRMRPPGENRNQGKWAQ